MALFGKKDYTLLKVKKKEIPAGLWHKCPECSAPNYNKELEVSALIHSLEMKKHNFFSHTNKKNKKMRNLDDRVKFSGYTNYKLLSENLYNGFIDLDKKPTYKEISYTIFKAFKVSKSHNENLLNADLKEIGSSLVFKTKIEDGFLYYYFTQNFGTKH